MRTIKFRGKRLDNGKWVHGDLLKPHTGTRIVNYDESEPQPSVCRTDFHYHNVDPATVGQFTGLLDKNGKEIYEGDIVRYYDDIEDELVSSHVIYHKESCSFCAAPTKLCGDYVGIAVYWQFEVIGNIHETTPNC